jgi:hypothetical protein
VGRADAGKIFRYIRVADVIPVGLGKGWRITRSAIANEQRGNLLAAAIARWPGVIGLGNPLVFFGLADIYIIALAIWDFRSRGRVHPATLAGGLIIIASQPLRLALSGTAAWMAFATWATSFVA